MTEEERFLFSDIVLTAADLAGLVRCLECFSYDHLPGPTTITMEDIQALHGLTAAFTALMEKHMAAVNVLD